MLNDMPDDICCRLRCAIYTQECYATEKPTTTFMLDEDNAAMTMRIFS